MPSFTPDPGEQRERRQGIIALVFLGLSLLTVYLPASRQSQVAAGLRSTVLRPFIYTQSAVARARVQASEAARLQREVDSLVAVLANRAPLAEENRRLRDLLGLAERLGPSYEAASVLRPGTEGSESMFLVDVGRRNGVRPGAPVIMEAGLVGVIREAGDRASIGMDWTHPDFRASAMTLDGETYGIVEPRRGDFREEDRLVLEGVPFHTALDTGTAVVTSGRGGVYPRGIPVGTVDGLADAEGGWRKSYWISPAVEVGSVTHVLVEVARDEAAPADLIEAMVDTAAAPDSAADGLDAGADDSALPGGDTEGDGGPPGTPPGDA